jgi:hypothetical protein
MYNLEKLSQEAKSVAYSEAEKYSTPILKHIELATDKGISLAEELGANSKIVEIGTLLMDVKIGEAVSLGKLSEHIKMSHDFTKELLSKYTQIPQEDKNNIEACVLEHHGKDKFYSIESEICCNADCYRFCTVEGISYVLRYFRDMEFTDLVNLINNKIEEKWNAISLDICKEELEPQYRILEEFMRHLEE